MATLTYSWDPADLDEVTLGIDMLVAQRDALLAGNGGAREGVHRSSDDTAPELPTGWTRESLTRCVRRMANTAQLAVAYVAHRDQAEVPIADVIEMLRDRLGKPEFDGLALGGAMTSLSAAVKFVEGDVWSLWVTDPRAEVYRMHPAVAAVVRDVLDDPKP